MAANEQPAATTGSRPLLDLLREEYDALGMVSYTGDGNGGWIPDLRAQDIEGIMRLLMAAGTELARCESRLRRQVAFHREYRERAIAAEQALGLYGDAVATPPRPKA